MSSIKLSPASTGSAIFTIEAPATSTNRTLTLPDQTGTVLTNAGPFTANASASAGAVTIDASNNVGIGTSSPVPYGASNRVLQLDGGSVSAEIRLTNNTTGSSAVNGGLFQMAGNDFYIWNVENSFLSFGTNNTERARIASDGQQSSVIPGGSTLYPEYKCRAWVNFNGTGTVAIRASGNVSSITDNGTGDYTVNFTTAMPDRNYAVTVGNGRNDSAYVTLGSTTTPTTSAYRLTTWNGFSTLADGSEVYVAVFR